MTEEEELHGSVKWSGYLARKWVSWRLKRLCDEMIKFSDDKEWIELIQTKGKKGVFVRNDEAD
jgi:hypothetical protein